MMIYRCTKEMLKDLKVSEPAVIEICNPLFSWHGKTMKIGRKKMVLLINDATKFCLVLYGVTGKEFKKFDEIIKTSVAKLFMASGFERDFVDGYLQDNIGYAYTKTKTRKQVGILNRAAMEVEFHFDSFRSESLVQSEISLFMNRMLIKNDDGEYIIPNEVMGEMLSKVYGEGEAEVEVETEAEMEVEAETEVKVEEEAEVEKRGIPYSVAASNKHEVSEELLDGEADGHICDKCVENKAVVHVQDVGDYCLDCYNSIIAEIMGVEVFDDFARDISIVDKKGKMHHFSIINRIDFLGQVWTAEEKNGHYSFEVFSEHDTNPRESLAHLHRKIIVGIGYKTLTEADMKQYISNAIQHGGKQYLLKNIGTISLAFDVEEDDFKANIDGMLIDWMEVSRAFSEYEGFVMDYQIRDKSDEVLGENMILRQYNISSKVIYQNFEKRLAWFIEDNFLSTKKEEFFREAVNESLFDLELVVRYGERKDVELVGSEMVERLMNIESESSSVLKEMIDRILVILGDEYLP